MTDRPIIFSAPMVRALLDGRKTQTRRLINPQPVGTPWFWEGDEVDPIPMWFDGYESGHEPCGAATREVNDPMRIRYGTGDRLYVRENFTIVPSSAYRCSEGVQFTVDPNNRDMAAIYAAGWDRSIPRWKPCIHQPRWASRLTLTVTEVRVQRLNDISEDDAEAEGCPPCPECHGCGWVNSGPDGGWQCTRKGCGDSYGEDYRQLWESLHGTGSWQSNPWVVAISFTVEHGNIDALPKKELAA